MRHAVPFFVGRGVTVHQPSIRARAAHDVVFDRRRPDDRRGWASQSVSRSWQTINHPENARTGTCAIGPTPRRGVALRRAERRDSCADAGGSATTAEFLVVNLITEHDVEANEQPAREGDFRLRASPPAQNARVATLEIGIALARRAGRLGRAPNAAARCLV